MTEGKKQQAEAFLESIGWGQDAAERETLAADFSTRRFWRLRRLTSDTASPLPKTAIFMQSDPDQGTAAFVILSAALRASGLAAPEVYEKDLSKNLVLMQDFGDQNVGKLLDKGADRAPFDEKAAELLSILHAHKPPDLLVLTDFTAQVFADQTAPFLDYYAPHISARQDFTAMWRKLLAPLDGALPRALLLRDFMPDNVMLLEDQTLGLIDFQDAGLGSAAYDLASWAEEVRRDGGLLRLKHVAKLYHERHKALDFDTLLTSMRLYSAQRHTRILGRLVALRRMDALPRVWNALQTLLHDDDLKELRPWFSQCKQP